MKSTYKIFKESVKEITQYYMLLVDETKSQRLVGSTNEWVLDNYYMISEQEKVLKVDLRSKEFRRLEGRRMHYLKEVAEGYLQKCHFQIDRGLLFQHLSQIQAERKDYFTYPEVCALLPLLKTLLIKELADLCHLLAENNAYHYSPTDKSLADMEKLNEAAQQNLLMMNIFNSLKKMTKLPVEELIDSVSYTKQQISSYFLLQSISLRNMEAPFGMLI